ncbi:hypothetical protein IHV12_15270 [Fictibacillus sp. 7GRE50]|uniref:hypothetical protein n=1 Tax=Fictibacillus sp. 7GRE50 TaxID=2745878 RepID=UPI0018CE5D3C|nr:hypothetical protein [Fictibacillus sp. 7GRE50]MBH0166282.1 hypothetical protein [Fictibacillus sp. 7GRE50]
MEKSIFFNSAPGDLRTYQASDFADYFGDVLSSGLLHTDSLPALQVQCDGTDLRTYVETGKAIIQGYAYENTTDLYLQHALPEATLDRIDRIILRLDKRNQSRFIKLFVLQGTAAAAPVAPTLQRDEFIFELSLAQIRVRANTSTLVPSDLIDERLDENLCGLVYSLISIPTSQFQAEWDAFMADIQSEGFASASDFAAHEADLASHVPYGVTTGTSNTYAVTLSSAPTAYVEGMAVSVKINVNASAASTLNVNGLGAKGVKKSNGTDVTNLKANGIYTFRYDGTSFILQGEGGSGNAVASDLLSGKTATTDAGEITGTMTNRSGTSQKTTSVLSTIPNRLYFTPPAGYYDGSTAVYEDELDFLASNIKQGVNMFGMVGNAKTNFDVGEFVIHSETNSYNNTNTTYMKKRTLNVKKAGTYRVEFRLNLAGFSPSQTIWGRIYKNGVPYGIERSLTNPDGTAANMTYNEDLFFDVGDNIEFWSKTNGSVGTREIGFIKLKIETLVTAT